LSWRAEINEDIANGADEKKTSSIRLRLSEHGVPDLWSCGICVSSLGAIAVTWDMNFGGCTGSHRALTPFLK
jgi:hypothetical protein